MNTDLRKMLVDAECRHLTESEISRIRDYARGMGGRLAAMRRIEEAEPEIVQDAVDAFCKKQAEHVARTKDAPARLAQELTMTLRYAAQASVRQDTTFFRKTYATWVGELLRAVVSTEVLVDGQVCLRAAVNEHLDTDDAAEVGRYLDIFLEELRA